MRKNNGDLTEVGRTRPERTMSGVVRGMAESSVPVDRLSWRGNPAGMNCCGEDVYKRQHIYLYGKKRFAFNIVFTLSLIVLIYDVIYRIYGIRYDLENNFHNLSIK